MSTKIMSQISSLSQEQQKVIRKSVYEKVSSIGETKSGKHSLYREIYKKIKKQFKFRSYRDIPKKQFNDALNFISGLNDNLVSMDFSVRQATNNRKPELSFSLFSDFYSKQMNVNDKLKYLLEQIQTPDNQMLNIILGIVDSNEIEMSAFWEQNILR